MPKQSITNWLFLVFYLSFAGWVMGQECQVIELPGEKVNSYVATDPKGFLWISSKQGWYRHDGNSFTHHPAPLEQDTTEYWQSIQSFFFTDQKGRKWFTSYGGLHYYTPEENTIKNVSTAALGDHKKTDLQIIFQNSQTDELAIVVDDQIFGLQPNNQHFSQLGIQTTAKRFAVDTFPDGTMRTLIGCFGRSSEGLEVFYRPSPDKNWRKKRIEVFSDGLRTLVNNAVVTTNGKAYLATNMGLFFFSWQSDSTSGELKWDTRLVHSDKNTFSPVLNPAGDEMAFATPFTGIKTVPIGKNRLANFSQIRIDTSHKFIFRIAYQNNKKLWGWKARVGLVGISLPLSDNSQSAEVITPLYHQSPIIDPSFLVTHESGAKLKINGRYIVSDNAIDATQKGAIPMAFRKYNNGEIDYLRYLGNNLLVVALNSSSVKIYEWTSTSISETKQISVGTDIACISRGNRESELWIGTPKGLYHYTGKRPKLILKKIAGLGNLEITAILPWKENWLILGSNQGIILYDIKKNIPTWGGWCNELLAGPIKIDQLHQNKNNEKIRFQSDKGIIEFDPGKILLDAIPLRPYILNYSINNIPQDQFLLQEEDTEIELNSVQNTLTFEVSTLGFSYSKGATITAELVGRDLGSTTYLPQEYISYSNLSTGKHLLQLTAFNGRGERGETSTLTIAILPPLWQRPWFLLLTALLLVGSTYLLLQLRTRQQLRQAATQLERQQALSAERDRIASELHDDLGGDLASMAFIIDGHNSLKELGVDAELDVSRLGQLANGAIKHMREMIWVLDDEQATLPTLAKQLLANAREMAEVADLSLQADIPDSLPELPLSSIQKKNILLMAKETMQNIRKHARASAFNLRLAVEQEGEQSYILLVITDNGQGLKATQQGEADKPLNHGHGLKNLHKRAEEINTALTLEAAIPRGTKVTLRCPIVPTDQ